MRLSFPHLHQTSRQLVHTCHSALICDSQKLPACDNGHTSGNDLTDRLNQMRIAAHSISRRDFFQGRSALKHAKFGSCWPVQGELPDQFNGQKGIYQQPTLAIRREHGETQRNHGHPMHPSSGRLCVVLPLDLGVGGRESEC